MDLSAVHFRRRKLGRDSAAAGDIVVGMDTLPPVQLSADEQAALEQVNDAIDWIRSGEMEGTPRDLECLERYKATLLDPEAR
ncbi:hypothetical protein ACIQCM_08715 [Pseudarthrobacter sp. NPDC092439]|uniref:hypothetical protein n=1 Tax=unclassified Pseudarthrobacter TaxID=2647000 RepID=UPI00382DEAA6